MRRSFSKLNLNSTAHVSIAVAVLVLALSAFFTVVFEVQAARHSVQDTASTLSDKLARQQMLQRAVRVADGTKQERAALQTLAIQDGGGAAFIAAVESLGRAAHVSVAVSSITAAPPQGNTPGSIRFSVRYSGSYEQCARFLQLLETMPASLSIPAVTLSYDGEKGGWSGTLTISALSFDTP